MKKFFKTYIEGLTGFTNELRSESLPAVLIVLFVCALVGFFLVDVLFPPLPGIIVSKVIPFIMSLRFFKVISYIVVGILVLNVLATIEHLK